MEKVIPTFYAEYGRYISRFRMIPSNIDALIPVERRTLLILNRFGYEKPIKSYKIDGCVIGELHPHGSAYPTLVNLVRNGFASDTDSTWGGIGLTDCPAPAARYSETRIKPWVSKFAFEFIKYVPWEMLELEKEPLYLPSILPLGLIGDGVINGISFHRTIIPRYKKTDLAKRLVWLLEHPDFTPPKSFNGKMTEEKYGPCIKPNKNDCLVVEDEKNAFYKLLMCGEGKVEYQPKAHIAEIEVFRNKKKQQINVISINGRAPNATFTPLMTAYEKNSLPLNSIPTDQSKAMHVCVYLEPKKGIQIQDLLHKVSVKYLNKSINFKCFFCNLSGDVQQVSIDQILLNCFHYWKNAYCEKIYGDILILNDRLIEYVICSFLQKILKNEKKTVHRLEDVLALWENQKIKIFDIDRKNRKICDKEFEVKETHLIQIYNKSPIRRLIEYKTSYDSILDRKQKLEKELQNIDLNAKNRVSQIIETGE